MKDEDKKVLNNINDILDKLFLNVDKIELCSSTDYNNIQFKTNKDGESCQ